MGYTHYWWREKELPQVLWDKFISDVNYFVTGSNEILVRESDSDLPPVVDEHEVRFNGKGSEGHETFALPRVHADGWYTGHPRKRPYYAFCKTAHKPYDKYVVEVLSLAELCFGDKIEISSDGDWESIKVRCEYKKV